MLMANSRPTLGSSIASGQRLTHSLGRCRSTPWASLRPLQEARGSELQLMRVPGKTSSKSKGKSEGNRMKKIRHSLQGDLQIELAASQRKEDDDNGEGEMIIPHEGGEEVVPLICS